MKAKGQTLLELVVVVSAVAIAVVGLVRGLTTSLKNSRFAEERSLAENYAKEAQEWLVFQRDTDWSELWARASSSGKSWCLATLSFTKQRLCTEDDLIDDFYKRELKLTAVDGGTLEALVEVSWPSENREGGWESMILNFQLTKWK